jgi:hypothetical protein
LGVLNIFTLFFRFFPFSFLFYLSIISYGKRTKKMALFANAIDLTLHEDRKAPKLASVNFVASSRVSEALAQSGHLALSAPSQIIGQFQFLKVNLVSFMRTTCHLIVGYLDLDSSQLVRVH